MHGRFETARKMYDWFHSVSKQLADGGRRHGGLMRRDERKPSHVRFRTTFRNCVYDLLRSRGYTETESDTEWELAWVDKDWIREHFDGQYLSDAQRINHFRNHYELTRKDNLVKNLKRTQRHLLREGRDDEAAAYDFFPGTYVLPADYGLFVEEFKTHPPGSIWIMKPTGSAQGKGIFLFNKLSQVTDWKKDYKWKGDVQKEKEVAAYVVQRYIENPQLIGGKKFDLRLYVLVTSYSPLTVYIYRAGFCRFSGYRYNTHAKNLGDTYVHLTNAAIQKTAPGYDAGAGCKWPLSAYKLYMIAKYGVQTTDRMFDAVEELVVNTLLSVQKVMINDKHCFEMYGYDILVDDTLKPWLIEVNASPSISADTMQDYDLKFGLLDDVFTVVDMETKLGGAVEPTVGGFDLIYNNGHVRPDKGMQYSSRLGNAVDRERQLKALHAKHSKRSSKALERAAEKAAERAGTTVDLV